MTPKQLFFSLLVRPSLMLLSGIRVKGREHLALTGPAIIVANHNSHLDTMALLSLFELNRIDRVRPVAAGDYFLATPLKKFISEKLIGILPVDRKKIRKTGSKHPLHHLSEALERGEILIIFPEGSRGAPGEIKPFKRGFAHLAKAHPNVPVIPVKIRGTDRALPKDEALWVPFIIDIEVENPYYFEGDVRDFTKKIEELFHDDR